MNFDLGIENTGCHMLSRWPDFYIVCEGCTLLLNPTPVPMVAKKKDEKLS